MKAPSGFMPSTFVSSADSALWHLGKWLMKPKTKEINEYRGLHNYDRVWRNPPNPVLIIKDPHESQTLNNYMVCRPCSVQGSGIWCTGCFEF